MSNLNKSVLKSNIEGNFRNYLFGKCLFLAFSEAKGDCWASRHLLC